MNEALIEILLNCLRTETDPDLGAALAALSGEDWHHLIELASDQRIRALLYHRLVTKDLIQYAPDDPAESLKVFYRSNTLRNLSYCAELKRLRDALLADNIQVIVLKGLYLATSVYDNIALREMDDVDLLVPMAQLQAAAQIANECGYFPAQPFTAGTVITVDHHLPRLSKEGLTAVEIHWNLTRPNEHNGIDPCELWERSKSVHITGFDAFALGTEDLILHLCYHTAYQHHFAFGLRPSCDISAAIARFGDAIDWEKLCDRSARWGWRRGVYLALRMAKDLAGAAVPYEVLTELRPPDFDEALAVAARKQIFADTALAEEVSSDLLRLMGQDRFRDKIKVFADNLFWPRRRMSTRFGAPLNSPLLFLYYPVRFFKMIARYNRMAIALKRSHNAVADLATREATLARWLAGE